MMRTSRVFGASSWLSLLYSPYEPLTTVCLHSRPAMTIACSCEGVVFYASTTGNTSITRRDRHKGLPKANESGTFDRGGGTTDLIETGLSCRRDCASSAMTSSVDFRLSPDIL